MSDRAGSTGIPVHVETVRQARERYFRDNGLSEAGYDAAWVKLTMGRFPLYLPNPPARRRAVALHDLHHVATGYATSWTGEAEISAWELAAGTGPHWIALLLDVGAASLGLVIAPRRTLRAFRRGRRSRSLYRETFSDDLLDMSVDDLRARLRL